MKSSGIGGQAVLEGVMMKNKSHYAVAVRTPDGKIDVTKGDCHSIAEKCVLFRLPILRGIVAFIESLVLGMKTLTYSSGFYEEENEKAEKKESSTKETVENVLIVLLAIVLAVGFFMILPFLLSEVLRPRIESQTVLAVIEGALRIVLFVGYVIAISMMSDIKRVFMYHGAEHKTINCVENGLELTVHNVRGQSKHHRRCGTSFLLIVMLVSIIFFLFIHIDNMWLRMLFRVLLVPVIAGVSYEFIRLAGNSDNKLVLWLSKPGLLLQRLTTREPDDAMIEVAIASVEAVFDWREYQRRLRAQQRRKTAAKQKRSKAAVDASELLQTAEPEEKPAADRKQKAEPVVEKNRTSKAEAKVDQKQASKAEAKADQKQAPKAETVTDQKPVSNAEPSGKKAAAKEPEKKDAAAEEPVKELQRKKKKETQKAESILSEEAVESEEERTTEKADDTPKVRVARRKVRKSRAQVRKEIEEREAAYRKRIAERARLIKEQEAREAELEKEYKDVEKRRAARLAAVRENNPEETAVSEEDDLMSLDHYFEETGDSKDAE